MMIDWGCVQKRAGNPLVGIVGRVRTVLKFITCFETPSSCQPALPLPRLFVFV